MRVLVIGGGAAGMMAALTAAERGHQVTLLERRDTRTTPPVRLCRTTSPFRGDFDAMES